jgi:hypothetical protein
MPRVLVVLFWCWFAVSIVILVRRGMNRPAIRRKKKEVVAARPPMVWPPLHEIDPLADEPAEEPEVVAPRRSEPRINRAKTIAGALEGIRLPCDLAPLTGGVDDVDRRAAFFTVGYPAEAVAP